jgi:hypothetical protein
VKAIVEVLPPDRKARVLSELEDLQSLTEQQLKDEIRLALEQEHALVEEMSREKFGVATKDLPRVLRNWISRRSRGAAAQSHVQHGNETY